MTDKCCKICGISKSEDSFSLNGKYRHSYCRPCEIAYKKDKRQGDRGKAHYIKIRDRARSNGTPFDLEISDFIVPEFCPVLGLRLSRGSDMECWPSLDRIDPKLGYTKGNVVVVSFLANRIKSNATVEQLGKVYKYYEQILS
jgi:hypothetical protein